MNMAATAANPAAANRGELWELRQEIEDFNYEYAEALDSGRLEDWPSYFTEDAFYRVIARENADVGLPVGLVHCEGLAMIKDRAFAIEKTAMFAPRYLMHMISNVRVDGVDDSGVITARANYLVVETLVDGSTRIHQAGRYQDRFVREGGRLLLQSRDCIYDTLLVDTALVFPV